MTYQCSHSAESMHDASPGSARLGGAHTRSAWRPEPEELAALGTVLCIWRRSSISELECIKQAVVAKACLGVNSMGVHEWISLFCRNGACSMMLFRLPSATRFDPWNRLMSRLPAECCLSPGPGACARLSHRVGDWLRGDGWSSSTLSFIPGSAMGRVTIGATLRSLQGEDLISARQIASSYASPLKS